MDFDGLGPPKPPMGTPFMKMVMFSFGGQLGNGPLGPWAPEAPRGKIPTAIFSVVPLLDLNTKGYKFRHCGGWSKPDLKPD